MPWDGGVQPERLCDYGVQILQVLEGIIIWSISTEDAVHFLPSLLANLGVECEEVESPGEALGRGVPASKDHVQDHVTEVVVGELFSLNVLPADEEGEQVAALLELLGVLLLPCLQDVPSELVHHSDVPGNGALLAGQLAQGEAQRPKSLGHMRVAAVPGLGELDIWVAQRVDVVAKGDVADGVQGVPVEEVAHVDIVLGGLHQGKDRMRVINKGPQHALTKVLDIEEVAADLALWLPELPIRIEDAMAQQVMQSVTEEGALLIVGEASLEDVLNISWTGGEHKVRLPRQTQTECVTMHSL